MNPSHLTHIVFYDDAVFYGGNEKKAVEIVRFLSKKSDLRITFLAYEGNTRFCERLSKIGGNFHLQTIPYRTKPTAWLRLAFETPQAWRIARLLRRLRPDRLVICAGSIDHCLKGLYAAKLEKIRFLMYIPQAHKASFLGSKLGIWRDRIQDFFYRRVDYWVTISRGMKQVLSTHGIPPEKISVVYNGIDTSVLKRIPKAEARAALGVPPDVYLIGNVGRFDFYVKNQGLVVKAMVNHPGAFDNALVAFVGEGDDEASLREMLTSGGLDGKAKIIPFQSDVSLLFSALDLVLISSKIEGMPHVMLEAMYYGIPVVSSDVDGMREVLPVEWRYPSGDAQALAECVANLRSADQSERLSRNREIMNRDFTLEAMCNGFLAAVLNTPACNSH
jgi:glycosyltransferase involved in cell wall biosynthesis